MECEERRLLLRAVIESNHEYRAALQRCRVCKTCTSESPEKRTACPLDAHLARLDRAHQAALTHCDEHKC
jgi:hypothetical protein